MKCLLTKVPPSEASSIIIGKNARNDGFYSFVKPYACLGSKKIGFAYIHQVILTGS